MAHAHNTASHSYGILLILVLMGALYVRGWVHLRSSHLCAIPAWRAASFLLGLFLTWVAVASREAGLVHELLTAHMVQHLLLMTVTAPLVWLGQPLIGFVHGLPTSVRERIALLFRQRSMHRLGKAITHPAVCWIAASGTLIGCHIPMLLALEMESPTWNAVVKALFLVTGLLFWWPVVQPWPSAKSPDWLTVVYLFLATLPCDILSGFLVFCDRVVYPGYSSSLYPFGLSALQDQQFAGALMWTAVTIIYFIAGGIITTRLLSPRSSQESLVVKQCPVAVLGHSPARPGVEAV